MRRMRLRTFIGLCVIITSLCTIPVAGAADSKPNIVFIMDLENIIFINCVFSRKYKCILVSNCTFTVVLNLSLAIKGILYLL